MEVSFANHSCTIVLLYSHIKATNLCCLHYIFGKCLAGWSSGDKTICLCYYTLVSMSPGECIVDVTNGRAS